MTTMTEAIQQKIRHWRSRAQDFRAEFEMYDDPEGEEAALLDGEAKCLEKCADELAEIIKGFKQDDDAGSSGC